ncbi:uncharacterized protein LOC111488447 isoform X1 [Cucurbita maxima]|uniref:Uncharacterized protein LOC111488447 isoform X1 n=1 Tax=Cucurbita maxima TaxID=3661 RepID=A0A6J1JNC5_CUCMA|nr:uncharacterized protein LOC111488447 isoform X1 [Cucurbita maxima]XP_022991952.1 uncharacterized protein LOC111488447 isoform X1 [Cucurbita maxima]
MDMKENGEFADERPPSPMWVLQHFSEEAFRVAGEALNSVYQGGTGLQEMGTGHRRARSEVPSPVHNRTNGFQRLKSHVQKVWGWGRVTRDEDYAFCSFDPEILANQKRQWYQFHSKSLDCVLYKEPTSLFEHFIIVGLHPDTNLETVEDAFAERKKWELQKKNTEMIENKMLEHRGPSVPLLEPQILFKYPPGKRLPMRMKDLSAFCFPDGVKAQVMERTPSLSELNEIVYGQEHLKRDDLAFIFSLKVANNSTLYGVCLHVQEIVQRPPAILGISTSLSHSPGLCSRFLVSAPRCYCLLTRVPFFDLHFEMLNSIIAQERLNRVTQLISEISLTDYVPSVSRSNYNENVDSPERESLGDWMASAIPIHSAVALTAAAAGIISDDEILTSSMKMWEPRSPESGTTSDASELGQAERTNGSFENGHLCTEMSFSSKHRALERLGSSESLFSNIESYGSPARSMASEDEDDDLFPNCEKEFDDGLIMEWARENKHDVLQIVCGYHALPVPERGCKLLFQPLEHLQSIQYRRPSIALLGFCEKYLDSLNPVEVKAKLASAEETLALSIWTTATLCRALSLETVLQLVAVILLEKQVIVVCPNLGLLSATVLSLVPMICPFQWQSLFLPVLPGKMFDLLDAPVPFIVGTLNRPTDVKMKTSNLVIVDVLKDQVKTCTLPTLPRHRELVSELGPVHAKLANKSSIAKKHPVYRCNESQTAYAAQFLKVMRQYMESLCSNLRSHTITSVQSNNDRVSLLLKDSFIDSFSSKDRPFIKLLVDTQLFSVLSDSRLSSFENGFCEANNNVPKAPMAEVKVQKVQMKKP